MEFLKSCTTNAQAIGDFEAVAYQAFSITRDTNTSPIQPRDWGPTEDTRAIEADLRQKRLLVAHDSSRPWLWLFKPTTAGNAGDDVELPVLEGYLLNREQNGSMKALELARPPMRPTNPHALAASSSGSSYKNTPGGTTRPAPSAPNSATDQSPDCLTLYELFASSVAALVSFFLVKGCGVVALNYRTFVSSAHHRHKDDKDYIDTPQSSWLTSLNVHWVSSGSLLVTTTTLKDRNLRCLDDISSEEQQQLVGECIRVAPNASLAVISSFDDPLNLAADELSQITRRKRAKITSLEQSIERWKATVERWLRWKGFDLPGLEKRSSWVRIRHARQTPLAISSPGAPSPDREILWPQALCYYRQSEQARPCIPPTSIVKSHVVSEEQKWFGSKDFQDPIDVAQEWFSGKTTRDKTIDMRRRSKKAEEEATRRKDEPAGLYPSSPLNSRTGVYGDLQAVSGVYPTPPDGIAPGVGMSGGDFTGTPATATNVILVPGGNNPAINLSGPQDRQPADGQDLPSTSPMFPETSENFATAGYDDDLFEDMEGDGPGAMGLNDEDFDFFDGPDDDDDVDMADAPPLPDGTDKNNTAQTLELISAISSDPIVKEEMPDPLTALETALEAAADSVKAEPAPPDPLVEVKAPVSGPPIELQLDASTSKVHKATTKVPTPPLSPGAIVTALESSPKHKSVLKPQSQDTPVAGNATFHSLDFSRRLSLADAKYQVGRFADRRESDAQTSGNAQSQEPTGIKSLMDIPLLTRLRYAVGVASASKQPAIPAATSAISDDSDTSSETSNESDDEETEDGEREKAEEVPPAVPPFLGRLIIPAKRRLPPEANGTPLSVTSFAESLAGEWSELHGLQLEDGTLTSFEPSSWDWSMIDFVAPVEKSLAGARFSMPSLPPPPTQLPDTPTSQPDMNAEIPDERASNSKDHVVITQLITEQVASTTLDLLNEGEDSDVQSVSVTESRWQAIVKDLFPGATECGVSALAAIHDVFPDLSSQVKGQQRPPPRKPNESNVLPGHHLYQINTPFIRVRRAETNWDLLPPAIAFWEPLGLAPASSPKNVVAFCIHPDNEALKPLLERFLLNAQVAYDTCKLGGHTRVETEYKGGLVPWKLESEITTPKAAFKTLRDTCVKLGQVLAAQYARIREEQDAKIDAFVIYMIDPFEEASAIWELCSAFWTLFHAYGQVPPGRTDQNQKPDLVLQIVPIRYIASSDAPVILDASTYLSLAREVYDRCPPSAPSTDKTPLNIYTAPSFHLEEGLPRGLPFKLISEPPQDLMRENSYMHLAYSISSDGTWITAAWTDNCGKSQAVVSYHLGTRVFGEIAKEIWQTTIEILQSRRVQWRVCIARAGPMDREELETWVLLITCPTPVNLFLTLLTVNTDSPYKLTPTGTITTQSTSQRPSTNTPGSTPQPGISPDPTMGLTPAATPSADAPEPSADPEARLVDVTDETWGIILAHRLHNSNSTNQFCPALISGLLVKRGETLATSNSIHHPIPDPMPGPITIAVNILWIGAVGSTRAATSPFPPASDGVSPGGYGANPATPGSAITSPSPSPVQERSTSSLMWTPTVQTRATAENLLKEVLGQYRGLGLLAKLRGMRGTMHGVVPWHVAAAKRGVEALSKVTRGV